MYLSNCSWLASFLALRSEGNPRQRRKGPSASCFGLACSFAGQRASSTATLLQERKLHDTLPRTAHLQHKPLLSLLCTLRLQSLLVLATATATLGALAPPSRFFTTVRVSCDLHYIDHIASRKWLPHRIPSAPAQLKTRSCLSGLAVATQAQTLADSAPTITTIPPIPRAALYSAATLLRQAASGEQLQLVVSAAAVRVVLSDSPKTKPASVHQPRQQAAACLAPQEERAQLVASAVEVDLALRTMLRALDSAHQTQLVCKEQTLLAAEKAILGVNCMCTGA
jgi:hypothetical protein